MDCLEQMYRATAVIRCINVCGFPQLVGGPKRSSAS